MESRGPGTPAPRAAICALHYPNNGPNPPCSMVIYDGAIYENHGGSGKSANYFCGPRLERLKPSRNAQHHLSIRVGARGARSARSTRARTGLMYTPELPLVPQKNLSMHLRTTHFCHRNLILALPPTTLNHSSCNLMCTKLRSSLPGAQRPAPPLLLLLLLLTRHQKKTKPAVNADPNA